MPDKHLPFMLSALSAASELVPGAKVNVTRIIEAIIIAMLTAGATTWAATQVLDAKLQNMEKRLDKVERQDDSGRNEILSSVNEVRSLVIQHIDRRR